MKISELQNYINEEYLRPSDDIESLLIRLVYDNKIKSFMPILSAYIAKMERDREYTDCELKESSSLLHLRRIGVSINGQDNRELHMINKHSSLSCDKELAESDYDYDGAEKNFMDLYNLK